MQYLYCVGVVACYYWNNGYYESGMKKRGMGIILCMCAYLCGGYVHFCACYFRNLADFVMCTFVHDILGIW